MQGEGGRLLSWTEAVHIRVIRKSGCCGDAQNHPFLVTVRSGATPNPENLSPAAGTLTHVVHAHAYTRVPHVCIHTCTCALVHACAQNIRLHARTYTSVNVRTYTHIHTQVCTCTLAGTCYLHMCVWAYIHMHAQMCAPTHIHADTDTRTLQYIHANTLAPMWTHMRIAHNTHAHTQP